MASALKKVLSVLVAIALAFSTWSASALAETSGEMGEEPAVPTKKVAGPTEDVAAAEEGSDLENPDLQPTDALVPISEGGDPERQLAVQDSMTVSSVSEEPEDALEAQANAVVLPATTENDWRNDYVLCASCRNSYLHVVNGRLERVEYQYDSYGSGDGKLIVEGIDGSLRCATSRSVVSRSTYVPSDLTSQKEFMWGGFYSGANHNYVLTGQTNDAENNNLTVFRLTKYTKAWQYVGNVEIKDAGVSCPFDFGSCSMIELNGDLHIRTCRETYTFMDGNRHQSNVQIVVDEDRMVVKQPSTSGFASHSFAQLLARSGDAVFGLDHGDGFPRAILVTNLTSPTEKSVKIFKFKGKGGDNTTGGSVGGMEHSSSASRLLVAGNLADQSVLFEGGAYNSSVARNVFVATTPTPDLSSSDMRYLTSYTPNGALSATTPHLVKIDENRFLVLWGEKNLKSYPRYSNKVYYQFVDGQGKALSATKQVQGALSDCAPVLWGNRVIWYAGGNRDGAASEETSPTFYAIGAYDGSFASYAPFPDVPADAWYAGVVYRAAGLGLINGYKDGRFGPNDNVTRGQVAVILWNMAGKPAAKGTAKNFPDVRAGKYYYDAVRWASSAGVVSGYNNGKFGPDDLVTREQLAAMLANYAGKVAGKNTSGSAADYRSMKDASKVSSWAARSVGWCFRNKILSGTKDGRVNPQGNATRAETAKMVVFEHDLL